MFAVTKVECALECEIPHLPCFLLCVAGMQRLGYLLIQLPKCVCCKKQKCARTCESCSPPHTFDSFPGRTLDCVRKNKGKQLLISAASLLSLVVFAVGVLHFVSLTLLRFCCPGVVLASRPPSQPTGVDAEAASAISRRANNLNVARDKIYLLAQLARERKSCLQKYTRMTFTS